MQNNALIHLKSRHLKGEIGGVCAVCSSHPMVLSAAMEAARKHQQWLFVEVTPNQVNRSGGYSGMTPTAFASYLRQLADDHGISEGRLVLGADHLGPHLWKAESASIGMQRSVELVRACVSAGFNKIHLDTAICCADDAGPELDPEHVAERAADLCAAAEAVARDRPPEQKPVYVIGNEVPAPGGDLRGRQGIKVTEPEDLDSILDLYRHYFDKFGLEAAWQRVIAVVVQPGVEFGDRHVAVYEPSHAARLSAFHARLPANITYEVHAADYQPAMSLGQMTLDHFVIFKIGPCLTYALRKILFALADIESEWSAIDTKSNLRQVMETVMLQRPGHWRSHYQGTADELAALRQYSLRDRIRYYWNDPQAVKAVELLFANLNRGLPVELLERHLPDLVGCPDFSPDATARNLVHLGLLKTLAPYFDACRVVV